MFKNTKLANCYAFLYMSAAGSAKFDQDAYTVALSSEVNITGSGTIPFDAVRITNIDYAILKRMLVRVCEAKCC